MTYNESQKIARCIESVLPVSDEVLVLDSYSTDDTVSIAQKLGAKIEMHPFEGYIAQRERSIKLASNDWILALDADEHLSPELQNEIKSVLENPSSDCYYLNRWNAINSYWLRHGSWFPHRIIRLFHKDKIKCGGNPPHDKIYPVAGASTEKLQGLLMHHCNEDIHDRMVTVNHHSSRAARHRFENGQQTNYFRILVKPFWKFIVEYFLRLGILDGFYGFLMARTTAFYIYLRESKLMELQRHKKS